MARVMGPERSGLLLLRAITRSDQYLPHQVKPHVALSEQEAARVIVTFQEITTTMMVLSVV